MSNGPIYTLGEQLYSADGIVTYRGFVTSTYEAVYIHSLPVESVELYDQALKLFRSFSIDRPILNVFAFEGQPYVITRPGPEQMNFSSWLSAQTAAREKLSSPPIIFQSGSRHSTPRPLDPSENKTVTVDPPLALPRESRKLSTPSTPAKTSAEEVGEFTRIFGPLEDSKHKGGSLGQGASDRASSPVPTSGPRIVKPARDGQDPLLKTIQSGWKERPDERGSFPSLVLRPHDRNGSWARSEFGIGPVETELPAPSKLRSTTPGNGEPEPPKSEMSEFTRFFGNETFDRASLTPPESPGNTEAPVGDFTRLIHGKNPSDRKSSSEPQPPEIKREELQASGPAYGPATRVFQSPRKDVGPASPSAGGGEFTRIYGPKDRSGAPPYSVENRPDSKRDRGGEEAKTEQPKVEKSPVSSVAPSPEGGSAQDKRRTSNLPLLGVVIFSFLIVVAVIAYLALRS